MDGTKLLSSAISGDIKLSTLTIMDCNLCDEEIIVLSEALKLNTSIKYIYLGNIYIYIYHNIDSNKINTLGLNSLTEMFKTNFNLVTCRITYNNGKLSGNKLLTINESAYYLLQRELQANSKGNGTKMGNSIIKYINRTKNNRM